MENFKKYKRTQIAEMRYVTESDISLFDGGLIIIYGDNEVVISISDEDLKNGSPKIGDMIARNPKNHSDQWLVAEQYFKDNFEQVSEGKNKNFV